MYQNKMHFECKIFGWEKIVKKFFSRNLSVVSIFEALEHWFLLWSNIWTFLEKFFPKLFFQFSLTKILKQKTKKIIFPSVIVNNHSLNFFLDISSSQKELLHIFKRLELLRGPFKISRPVCAHFYISFQNFVSDFGLQKLFFSFLYGSFGKKKLKNYLQKQF